MKQIKCFVPAVFCVLLLAVSVQAADYYVDSENGNDENAGTAPAAAWKTLRPVNRAEYKPGDRVLFKKGGLWRGTLTLRSGAEGKELLYSSYGEGAKPRIYGSVPLNEESDWIDQGNGLWATRPTEIVPIEPGEPTAFLSGGWSVHTEEGASVERSIQGNGLGVSMKLTCKKAGNAPNHIQLINAPFAIKEGKYYRLTFRAASTIPFESPAPRLSMAGSPWSGYGATLASVLKFGTEPAEQSVIFNFGQTAEDGRVTFSLGKSFPEGAVLTLDQFRLEEVKIFDLGLRVDVGNVILDGKSAAWKKWTKEDLTNPNDFWFDIKGDQRLWFKSDKNPALVFESMEAANMTHIVNHSCAAYVVVEGLDLRYGGAHGFGGTKANHLTIRDCDLSWIGGGDQYRQGGEGRRVRFGNAIEFWSDAADCLVENCRIWEVYDAALTNQGSGSNVEANITYRNNLIWNSEYSFEYWNRDETSRTENILFENNRCYNAGYGWGHVQRPNKNGAHLMFYNNSAKTSNFVVRGNIFCESIDVSIRMENDWRDALTLDGNRYWQSEKPILRWLNKNYYQRDELKKIADELGMEKNGVFEKMEVPSWVTE